MPVTDEFRKILRKNLREFGETLGKDRAFQEAKSRGVDTFRPRKEKTFRFKRQDSQGGYNFY